MLLSDACVAGVVGVGPGVGAVRQGAVGEQIQHLLQTSLIPVLSELGTNNLEVMLMVL